MNVHLFRTIHNQVSISQRYRLWQVIYLGLVILFLLYSPACRASEEASIELLIGIKSESILLLVDPTNPDPTNTGITSLDELNANWDVLEMKPVFPDVSSDDEAAQRSGLSGIFKLIVGGKTDLDAMLAEYQADQHIEYIEVNKPVEIK